MKESTKVMIKKHGWRIDKTIHNYIYFIFYYPYVNAVFKSLPLLKYLTWFKPIIPLGKMVFNRYHSKVMSIEDTKKILSIKRNINVVSNSNKSIIPFKYATDIIFQEPEFIVVMDCPCKKSAKAPEETINSCIAVGKGVASFWLDHCSKYNPRKISQKEAIQLITELRKSGHITQSFFKVATGGCTGVICNCHPDTCASLQATMYSSKIDKSLSMTADSGYSINYDDDKCKKCNTCEKTCSFDSITFNDNIRKYDKEKCLGCGLCIESCPESALSQYIDSSKPLPLDLDMIMAQENKNEDFSKFD